MTGDLFVFGPRRDQAKLGQAAGYSTSLVTLHNNGRSKAWIGLSRVLRWKIYSQLFFDPLALLGWREVCAHASSLVPRDSPNGHSISALMELGYLPGLSGLGSEETNSELDGALGDQCPFPFIAPKNSISSWRVLRF